ncbi:MAG TPA: hypothetical protein VLE54_07960, partial [Thermoanaerobaculia bacterium]|nr:hypothetical protein [Thermoanaerobaculia bacterium]
MPKTRRMFVALGLVGGLSLASLLGAGGTTALASVGGLSGLAGISGKLLAIFTLPGDASLRALAGAPTAGVSLIVMKPFSAKVDGRIGNYRMGNWPYEGRTPRSPNYAPPKGFIEVTPENFGTRVSEHFTVGQFLTKDQSN